MKFVAYVKQWGEGCDYTIGCGQTLWLFEATTIEAARQEVGLKILEISNDETKLESVTIYGVALQETVDTERIYKEEKQRELILRKQKEEDVERKEFERLKNKFKAA